MPEEPPLDIDRLIETLNRHEVTFVLVGGVSAVAHGATRPTKDLDCVVERGQKNLTRLATAMRELNARLRVEGLSDEDAKTLPTVIDAQMFGAMEISTWRTDAGDFDVLAEIPDRTGRRLRYEALLERSTVTQLSGRTVASTTSSRPKNGRTAPKTTTRYRSCDDSATHRTPTRPESSQDIESYPE